MGAWTSQSDEQTRRKKALKSLATLDGDYQMYGTINGIILGLIVYSSSCIVNYGFLLSSISDYFPWFPITISILSSSTTEDQPSLISTISTCIIISLIGCRVLIALGIGLTDSVRVYPDHPSYYTYWVTKRTVTNCVWSFIACLTLEGRWHELTGCALPLLMLSITLPFALFGHVQSIMSKEVQQWRQYVARVWLGKDYKQIPRIDRDNNNNFEHEDHTTSEYFCLPWSLALYLLCCLIVRILGICRHTLSFYDQQNGMLALPCTFLDACIEIAMSVWWSVLWGARWSIYILAINVVVYICNFKAAMIDVENMEVLSDAEKQEKEQQRLKREAEQREREWENEKEKESEREKEMEREKEREREKETGKWKWRK